MFYDREDAGLQLASSLVNKPYLKNSIIIAIPRGGVAVAKKVSQALSLPLFAMIVKKISSPDNPELAVGATSDGSVFWDNSFKLSPEEKERLLKDTRSQITERKKQLSLKPFNPEGKSVILVDDGVATGATVIVSSLALKSLKAKKIILATPVISQNTKEEIAKYFDEIVQVLMPETLFAVGQFYINFSEVTFDQVRELLKG